MQAEALKLSEASNLVHVVGEESLTTSLLVAEKFGKQHKNVIWVIENMGCSEEFGRLNFKPSSYLNEQNKTQPMYEMTRDGFSLLVMGFTGKKAMEWKEKYIAAFNRMEQEIRRMAIENGVASGKALHPLVIQLLAEDRISRMALPDGTVLNFKKLSPVKAATKAESSPPDLRAKVLAIVKKLGDPTAREIKSHIRLPGVVIQNTLALLVKEGRVGIRKSRGQRGPKTSRFYLNIQ